METDLLHVDEELVARLARDHMDPELAVQADGIFVSELAGLGGIIQSTRVDQDVQPYTVADLRYLMHFGLVSRIAHKGQARKSSEEFWRTHLVQTDTNLVAVVGRTRLALLGAGFNHDVKEDTEIKTFEQFWDLWVKTFRDPMDPLIVDSRTMCHRVWNLVRGASKIDEAPGSDVDSAVPKTDAMKVLRSAATLRKLLSAIQKLGLDLMHLKVGGDRLHNMQTIEHQSRESQERIARETYDVFCRFGDIVGIQDFVRLCVDLCVGVLNPDLKAGFDYLLKERLSQRLDAELFEVVEGPRISLKQYLDSVFKPDGKPPFEQEILRQIKATKISPASLADFVMRYEEPLDQLSLSGLSITAEAPLFQVALIVHPGTEHNHIIGYLLQKFKKSGERHDVKIAELDALPQRGTLITIYSATFGTLQFRINDAVSEARAKRGVMPISTSSPMESDPLPPAMTASVGRILRETKDDPSRTPKLCRELFLRPTITVLTPQNKPITLPQGATALDFASAVHRTLPRDMVGASVIESDTEEKPIDPFAPLKNGMRVRIEKKVEGEASRLDPSFLLFCQSEVARTSIKNILKKQITSQRRDRGRVYTENIARLFGIQLKDILEMLRERETSEDVVLSDEVYFDRIWRGEVDLLAMLRTDRFKDRKKWRIRVELENRTGILHDFLEEFKNQGFNVDNIIHIPQKPPKNHILRMEVTEPEDRRDAYKLMRMFLKLNYSYSVAVSPDDWKRRLWLRVADLGRIAWNFVTRPVNEAVSL